MRFDTEFSVSFVTFYARSGYHRMRWAVEALALRAGQNRVREILIMLIQRCRTTGKKIAGRLGLPLYLLALFYPL